MKVIGFSLGGANIYAASGAFGSWRLLPVSSALPGKRMTPQLIDCWKGLGLGSERLPNLHLRRHIAHADGPEFARCLASSGAHGTQMLTLAAVLNLEGAAPDHRRVYAVAGRFMLHSAMSSA